MNFREDTERSRDYKQRYADGLNELIVSRRNAAASKRKVYSKDILTNREAYVDDLKEMLGWPMTERIQIGAPKVRSEMLAQESGFSIHRMSFEILDGVEMTGLYFRMDSDEKKPLVLVQHGGKGSPEHISGIYGDTTNYNRMLERVISCGAHAFAPQLLLWDQDKCGVCYDRWEMDAALKRVGSSIAAVELYGLIRILDYFETLNEVSSFGMVGLSYGGFYTLLLSAVDTRIRSAISCAFFNTRDKYPWCDFTWLRSAEKFDDAEIACLVYPRKLCIEIGQKDQIFDSEYAIRSYGRIKEICADISLDWLSFIQFDGEHEFCKIDDPIRNLINDISGK